MKFEFYVSDWVWDWEWESDFPIWIPICIPIWILMWVPIGISLGSLMGIPIPTATLGHSRSTGYYRSQFWADLTQAGSRPLPAEMLHEP